LTLLVSFFEIYVHLINFCNGFIALAEFGLTGQELRPKRVYSRT